VTTELHHNIYGFSINASQADRNKMLISYYLQGTKNVHQPCFIKCLLSTVQKPKKQKTCGIISMYTVIHFLYGHKDSSSWSAAKKVIQSFV
jgi:hypothetical protein